MPPSARCPTPIRMITSTSRRSGWCAEHPEIDCYLFGHRHLLIDLALRGDKRIVILGDWLQYNSFAVWDGTSLFVDQFIEDEA